MRCFALTSLLWCTLASAGTAELSWTAPTQNVDGSAYTNPGGYRVYRRCDTGALAQIADVPHTQLAYTDTLPDDGRTCWWSLTAYNTLAEESARTNEVSKAFPASLDIPGNVSATFAWQIQGPPDVTLTVTGTDFVAVLNNSTTGANNLPGTVNAGDFAVHAMSGYNSGGVDKTYSLSTGTPLIGATGFDTGGTGGNKNEGRIWYEELTGSEDGATRTLSSSPSADYFGLTTFAMRGDGTLTYKASSLSTVARGTGKSITPNAPGVDGAVGDKVVFVVMLSDPPDTGSDTIPSGYTEVPGNTSTNTAWMFVKEVTSAGAVSAPTYSWTGGSDRDWLAYMFLVEDAGAAAAASLPPINHAARMAAMIVH